MFKLLSMDTLTYYCIQNSVFIIASKRKDLTCCPGR